MLEILQISATANTKGLHVAHSGAVAGTGYGIWAEKTGASTTNVAGYFSASGATNNYAIIVPSTGGNVGIGTSAPAYKLQLTGSMTTANPLQRITNSGTTGMCLVTQNSSASNLRAAIESYISMNTNNAVPAIYGQNAAGTGQGRGIEGYSASSSGYGIFGSYPGGAGWAIWANSWAGGTTNWQGPSDERLKKDINPMQNALEKILMLNSVSFTWDKDRHSKIAFPEGLQFGFIAQEVEKIFPNIVHEKLLSGSYDPQNPASSGEIYKCMDYTALIPVLTKAIQEQNVVIEQLKKQIEEQNKRIDVLENH